MARLWINRLLRGLLGLTFFSVLFRLALINLGLSKSLLRGYNPVIVGVFLCLIAVIVLSPPAGKTTRARISLFLLFFMVTLSIIPLSMTMQFMGVNDVSTILLFLQGNSASEAVNIGLATSAKEIVSELLNFAVFLASAWFLLRSAARFAGVLALTTAALLWFHPIVTYLYRSWFPAPEHALLINNPALSAPKITAYPETRLNVVFIALEGYEQTWAELKETAPYVSDITNLRQQAARFTDIHMVSGANNSLAGMMAMLCGVPHLPRNTFGVTQASLTVNAGHFISGIRCLPDILHAQGYQTVFSMGASPDKYSFGDFLRSHSIDTLHAFNDFPKSIRQGDSLLWGVRDNDIFDFVDTQLAQFAKSDKPFFLSLLTIATHGPNGFPDIGCVPKGEDANQYAYTLRCTAAHVSKLINRLDELGLRDNTLIVIASDHLSWPTKFTDRLNANGHRRNLVLLLDPARTPQVIDKPGTAFDVYPSILKKLGYSLKNDRAYLGTSLLSPTPSLTTRLGPDRLSKAIKGNMALSRKIWAPDAFAK
ncbi:LTA synthase family protein [Aquicoccus sp. G2-2]|uniref:LTA synthase family protein n=1 Tax=Aquicoccus sp. G2-2 TaxID=3092120 RepID=UPI002ADF708C|nr:LTA synthase family protein [Aquicoccus sp. G2-2]MEA1112685.1 LTA synthase family protein [Aquicoccus sp. G2-2]